MTKRDFKKAYGEYRKLVKSSKPWTYTYFRNAKINTMLMNVYVGKNHIDQMGLKVFRYKNNKSIKL